MEFILEQTYPSPSGGDIVCRMTQSTDGEARHVKGEILCDLFSELALPTTTDEPTKIDEETYKRAEYLMKMTDAVKKCVELLSYSQNTRRALYQKLVLRGFARDVSADAVEYVSAQGLIDEFSMAQSLVYDMASRRLYGRQRIKSELLSKGFPIDVCERAIDQCEEDFVELCRKMIEKLGGVGIFEDRTARAKAISSLMRHGFSFDEIKSAIRKKNA